MQDRLDLRESASSGSGAQTRAPARGSFQRLGGFFGGSNFSRLRGELYYVWLFIISDFMTAKCNCNNCSSHLEFDSANAGQVITCPSCGMETKLYVPPPAPVPKVEKTVHRSSEPIANPLTAPSSTADTLKLVRQESCYKTLRGLIDLVQVAFFIGGGFSVLMALATVFFGGSDLPIANHIGALVIGLASGFILVVLGIAWKQAALLLVDIADCQIRLAQKS